MEESIMRLEICIDTKETIIPYEYHRFLQAIIYRALNKETADFYHDKGYSRDNRHYKMFVFSELRGKYIPQEKGLLFQEDPSFFIASVDSDFLNQIYAYYSNKGSILFGTYEFNITRIGPVEDMIFHKSQEYMIQTLSPVSCYKTDEKRYKTYFNPKSEDFEKSVSDNLKRKADVLGIDDSEEFFEIKEVKWSKETRVKFKGSLIPSYHIRMIVKISNQYLKLLMHTGMGAKNSSGFGMIKIVG